MIMNKIFNCSVLELLFNLIIIWLFALLFLLLWEIDKFQKNRYIEDTEDHQEQIKIMKTFLEYNCTKNDKLDLKDSQ